MILTTIIIAGSTAFSGTLFFVFFYNKLSSAKVKTEEALSGIDVQLNKRKEMISHLILELERNSPGQRDIIDMLRKAESMLKPGQSIQDKAKADDEMRKTVNMTVDMGHSPSQEFMIARHTETLNEIKQNEKDLELARRYYNALARDYNLLRERFPSAIAAMLLNFKKAEFFNAHESE